VARLIVVAVTLREIAEENRDVVLEDVSRADV
jgi:hypothetical protein